MAVITEKSTIIKRCLKSVKAHNFKDGKQTQPSNETKSNEESINIPDDVRKLITDRFYDTHYVDSVYCPTRVSVNFYNKYTEGDFYDYHQDAGHNIVEYEKETRKLSMTVQLSDPNTYEGGNFYFYNGHKDETEPEIQEQGSILVFDSRMWHRVSPVTKGVRYSLVSWILGPRFQ